MYYQNPAKGMMNPSTVPQEAHVDLEMAEKMKLYHKLKIINGRLTGIPKYLAALLPYHQIDSSIAVGVDQVTLTISVGIPPDSVQAMIDRERQEKARRMYYPSAPKEQ